MPGGAERFVNCPSGFSVTPWFWCSVLAVNCLLQAVKEARLAQCVYSPLLFSRGCCIETCMRVSWACPAGLLQGEKSERVLQLTADVIDTNSADYTAWQHRWDTLVALQADLQQECAFTE